jgi:filamentous hemagglutinin family protein
MEVKMTDRAPLRSLLLAGCALAGVSAAPQRAAAQAFDATPLTVFGGVMFDRATPGVETITVNTDQAIILWKPNSAIFLPGGNVATFQNGPSNGDYAVLNRILSNAPVRFDGTVLSRIQNFALGTSQTGGTVLFSSPGGIIIGSTAMFDVGSLVLTTLDVEDDGSGTGTFFAPDGTLTFSGGATRPASAVITEPGAQILALNEGSYVAMVAPVVQHGGSVRVNGAAAYVAAEAVEMRVNAGLFDIVVAAGGGSDNANPLTHTGTTGGPASTGAGDTHAIYFVAVPKNQAITAILQGNVGFDAASVAGVENGVIVLSAGYSLFGGQPDRFGDFGPTPKPGIDASFQIRGGTISSDLFGYAITDMLASGQATGGLAFQQDVSLFGGARAHLFAGPGETVTVAGNALVSAAHTRSATPDNTGGEALIFAQNGRLEIFGDAIVDATGQGTVDVVLSVAGSGVGGTAGIFASGDADLRVRGATQVLAPGRGGVLDLSPDRGGTGIGGTAFVEGRNGGSVQLDGDLDMDASGTASRSNGSINPGANGSGGTARVAATGGGAVLVAGAPTLTANGTGGAVTGGTVFAGGTGRGGTITLAAAGIVTFNGNPMLAADGFGADGPIGGNALGGTINIGAAAVGGVPGASILTAGTITGTASATGIATTSNGPGAWHVVANGAGTQVNLANLNLTAAVNGLPATLTASTLEPRGGTINIAGTANLVTPADINVIGDAGGRVTGGLVDMDAGRDVLITHNARGANPTIDVANLNIDGESVTVAAGAATRASNRTNVAARATFTAGGAMDGREIVITSAGANVQATGSVGTAATELADLRATGTADIAGRMLARTIVVQGAAVNVAGGANVGGAPTISADLIATNAASVGGTVLGTTINVRGASVSVTPGGNVGNAATALADLRATGAASVSGNLLGTAINLQGASVTVAAGGNVGGAGTSQTRLTATGNAGIGGTVVGRDIQVASSDIDLTGALGNAGTQVATLQVNPATQPATLGGGAQGPGYTLTNAEAGRIRAEALRINVPALGANPALFVRDLNFTGGGAAAGIGTLAIATPGIARVEGNLLMTGARPADGIALTATQRLEAVTPAGSVRVRDGAGAPGGTLAITSNNIWVASAAIIDRLRLDANYAGRDGELIDSGGVDAPRGYVEANAVTLITGGTLFVQNTTQARGTFASGLEFGGISAGPGGLVIRSAAAPATVTAFGRRLNADGSSTIGYDYFFAVNFQPPGALAAGYTGASTFNTCNIVAGACPAKVPPTTVPGRDPLIGPTGGSDSVQLPPAAEADDAIDTSFAAEPLIEEPVTSGGEANLWDPECDRDHDVRCDGIEP